MPTIWMVSAHFGEYTDTWIKGGYAAVGWLPEADLTSVDSKDEVKRLYKEAHPTETPSQVGANAGQLARFIREIKPDDYVMTRWGNPTKGYRYGVVEDQPLYYAAEHPDGCPFPHRRKVEWRETPLMKENLSIPFQRHLSAAKTLFEVKHMEEFLVAIGEKEPPPKHRYDLHQVVLDQIGKISDKEFEDLVADLMEAMGFSEVKRVGRPHDGGTDVTGVLESNFVNVNVIVQAKHYKRNKRVGQRDVGALLGSAMIGQGQGVLVTTADFNKGAIEAAAKPGFPYHVTLINGHRLVELLMECWNADSLALSPDEDVPSWHERLGLTQGLVPR